MKAAIAIAMALSLAVGLFCGIACGQQPPPIPAQEQPEVLTRGPVHEAFAEPVILQNQAGLVVPKQPPPNIEEIPPAERPKGDHYEWVPGYWSWDKDRSDFIWVSACWRAAPPGMSWVPGYWSQVTGGWEWVAGFWTSGDIQDMEYLPAPPTIEDVEAPGPPPSSDEIWVPPCPYWSEDQYVIRPGYWLAERPDWVWVPSYYVWTPRGYVLCNGHWDYPFENRGMLFAPVYFSPSVYVRAGFSYTPSIVVDLRGLLASMFTYPRYCHYFFGDYYSDAYINVGIYPWFDFERIHTWYDPIYTYNRWRHRLDEPGWDEDQQHEYDLRRGDRDLRPPRTYHDMEVRQEGRLSEQQRNNFRMAEPLTAVATERETPFKLEHINSGEQQKIATQATVVHAFGTERNRWESAPTRQETTIQPSTEQKVPVIQPTEHQQPITPPPEHGEPATRTIENRKPVTTPPEYRQPVTPSTEQREPVTTPAEQKGYVPPPEHPSPITPPAGHEERVIQPRETQTPFFPPHEVPITQPERVKVPPPPFVGRQSAAKNPPPPRPTDEGRFQGGVRETPRENPAPRNRGK